MITAATNIEECPSAYAQNLVNVTAKREKNLATIANHEGHINRLVDANDKMRSPSWMDELVKPVAAILEKNLGANYDMQIVPSFGTASASVTILFTRRGIYKVDPAQLQPGDALRMTLRPTLNDVVSPLGIVNYTRDLGLYEAGSVGALTGLNHPTIPMIWTEETIMADFWEQNGGQPSTSN